MRREWVTWLGFTAVVLVAVVFVLSREDYDESELSAGTSVPTTTVVTPATTTTVPPPATMSSSTTAPPTTREAGPSATGATAAVTQPPVTQAPVTQAPTIPPPTTVPPATEPPLRVRVPPGTYRVGIDLPAGTYQTSGGGPYCFWARLRTLTQNPTPDDVIASEQTGGSPAVVTIQPTDVAFVTSGCEPWLSF